MIGTKTVMNFLSGVVTKKSPMYVQFALEKNCNLKCEMCGIVDAKKHENNLSLTSIEKIASLLDEIGVTMVILTGGEPLMRKDLHKVVKIFRDVNIEVRVQSNGYLLTEEKVKALIDAGVNEFTISLDTLNPEKQDKINRKKGSWEKAIKAISILSQHVSIRGNLSGINTVVSKMNYLELPALIEFVTKTGLHHSLIPVHTKIEKGSLLRKRYDEMVFTEEEFPKIDAIYKQVLEMKKQGYHVYNTKRFLRESPDYLKYGKVHWKCTSPDLYFSISPSGKYIPCVDMDSDFNMLSLDFMEKYRSGEVERELRKTVDKCSGCMYACYPEITYFCNDKQVFFERVLQGFRTGLFKRKSLNFQETLNLANELNHQHENFLKQEIIYA
jgi:MoaA/NifB/PqqE/SkfB family radical SAM enzyme